MQYVHNKQREQHVQHQKLYKQCNNKKIDTMEHNKYIVDKSCKANNMNNENNIYNTKSHIKRCYNYKIGTMLHNKYNVENACKANNTNMENNIYNTQSYVNLCNNTIIHAIETRHHTYIYIHESVCTMYIHIFTFISMYVHSTYIIYNHVHVHIRS